MKYFILITLGLGGLVFGLISLWPLFYSQAAPSQVADGTSAYGTAFSFERKVIRTSYGPNSNRVFVLAIESNIVMNLYYSDDAEAASPTWNLVGDVNDDTSTSAPNWESADMIQNSTDIWIVYGCVTVADSNAYDLKYRQVSSINTTPSLGSETDAMSASPTLTYSHPVVAIAGDSGTQKLIFFASEHYNGAATRNISMRTLTLDGATLGTVRVLDTAWTANAASGILGASRMNTDKLVLYYYNGTNILATRHDDSADVDVAAGWDNLAGGDTLRTAVSTDDPGATGAGSIAGDTDSDSVWFGWIDGAFDINTRRWNGSALDTELVPVAWGSANWVVGPALTTDGLNLYMVYQKASDASILVYQSRTFSDGTSAWSGTETTIEDSAETSVTYPSISRSMYDGVVDVLFTTTTNYYIRHAMINTNSAPTITVSQPDGVGDTVTVGDSYNIYYDLADSDNGVTVVMYYDSDGSGLDGTAITGACAAAGEGSGVYCTWDTTGVTLGSYYIYGITKDPSHIRVTDYSPGQITISAPTITVSGTCDQYDRNTDCTDSGAEVIAVAVNGVLQAQTDGTVDGSWLISGVTQPSANATITVFINGEATTSERATAVTKYNASGTGNIGGVVLYQWHLTIGSDQNTTVANSDMDDYDYNAGSDPDDADIIYDVDASNDLTVDNLGSYSDEMLLVLTSNIYQPDSASSGNVTTHDIEIDGTVTANNNTFYIGGSWNNDATFTANGSTVNFNTSTGTETIDSTGATISLFNNLTHSSASTLQLITAIDVNGTFSQTSGTFNCSSQNQNFASDVSLSLGTAYTKGGTLTLDGATQVLTDSTAAPGRDLGVVTIGPSTITSVSTANKMNVTNLTIGADDTLDISGDTLSVSGDYTNPNTLTATGSTVDFTKSSSTQTLNSGGIDAGKIFNNLTHSGAGTLQLITNAINIDGVFTNSNGTFDANDFNMNVADDFLVSGGSFSADVSPGATTQTVTFDGTNGATVSGSTTFNNLVMNSTTDAKTIIFPTGSSNKQIISGTWTLDGDTGNVLTLQSATPATAWYFQVAAAFTAGDYINVTDSWSANSYKITPGANTTNGGNNDGWIFNQAPNVPTNLGPAGYIDAAGWINDNTPTFNFDITDPDPSEQVKYRIQIDDTAGFGSVVLDYQPSSFGAEGTYYYTVGQAGSYAVGSESMTLSDSAVGGGYYWQVKAIDAALAESAYEEAGVDSTIDFRVDASAPTGGTGMVYDGESGDQDWNDGTLNSISANWLQAPTPGGFDASSSGLLKYEYAVRRTSDSQYWNGAWQADEKWYDNGTNISVTVTPIYLNTGDTYYFSVKCYDNAGNTENAVSSNGQQVSPTLSFSFNPSTVTFDNLHSPDWTDSQPSTITTSTNAANGYTVSAFINDLLKSTDYPSQTIINDTFQGTHTAPETWETGEYGFGYTTNDPDVNSGKFQGSKYAACSQTAPGDAVADHTAAVNGQTGAINNEPFIITYKVAVSNTQAATTYQTYVTYIVTANY